MTQHKATEDTKKITEHAQTDYVYIVITWYITHGALLQSGIHLSPCIHCAWLQLIHCASIQSGIHLSPSIHWTLLQSPMAPIHFTSLQSGIHLAISFLAVHIALCNMHGVHLLLQFPSLHLVLLDIGW